MNDALGVGDGQALGNSGGNCERLAPWHRAGDQAVPQGYALQQLRDAEGNPLLWAQVIQDQDVRMGQGSDRLGLPFEACQAIGVLGQRLRHNLDRNFAVQAGVFGAIDLAHTSLPQWGDDLIRAQSHSNGQHPLSLSPRQGPLPRRPDEGVPLTTTTALRYYLGANNGTVERPRCCSGPAILLDHYTTTGFGNFRGKAR